MTCTNLRRGKNRPDDIRPKGKWSEQGKHEAELAGLKHYSGTACNKCGGTIRYTNSGACLACGRKHAVEQRLENPDKFLQWVKEWRDANPDYIPPSKLDKEIHQQKTLERSRRKSAELKKLKHFIAQENEAWTLRNPEDAVARLAQILIWETTKEKEKRLRNAIESRIWRAQFPLESLAFDRTKRAMRMGAPGRHTGADIKRIGDLQRWRCGWCKKACKNDYHVDHIKPLSKGGSNNPSNLLVSCGPCNMKKKAKDPIVWAQSLGWLL